MEIIEGNMIIFNLPEGDSRGVYKIINVKDHNNHVKTDLYNKLEQAHPNMLGTILNEMPIVIGEPLRFLWADNSNKILVTSTVTGYMRKNDFIQVVTKNSIYILKKVEA